MSVDIAQFTDRLVTLDLTDLLRQVLNLPEIGEFIIELNTQGQLFRRGVNNKNETVQDEYSQSYQKIRQRAGLPTRPVSLFFTGDFYDTFETEVTKKALSVVADDEDKHIFSRYGTEVIGLTEQNLQKLVDRVQPLFQEKINEALLIN